MLVDSHAHIYLKRFDNDREAMLERANEAGVGCIVMPAIDVPSIHQAIALAENHEGLYAMAALHPSETKEATDADFDAVATLCDHPKVCAVGESGLDYYWDRSFDARQYDFFRRHIRLAIEKDLPLILHNREASDDLLRILEEERAASDTPEKLRGILHCFTGPKAVAEQAKALGFLLGIGGIVTFKNGGLAEVIAEVPLADLVIETDAPFLAPVPFRGKRNEPSYVKYVAEKIAAVKGVSIEEVERVTTQNALSLFDISDIDG